jgi:hypothetical protein
MQRKHDAAQSPYVRAQPNAQPRALAQLGVKHSHHTQYERPPTALMRQGVHAAHGRARDRGAGRADVAPEHRTSNAAEQKHAAPLTEPRHRALLGQMGGGQQEQQGQQGARAEARARRRHQATRCGFAPDALATLMGGLNFEAERLCGGAGAQMMPAASLPLLLLRARSSSCQVSASLSLKAPAPPPPPPPPPPPLAFHQ